MNLRSDDSNPPKTLKDIVLLKDKIILLPNQIAEVEIFTKTSSVWYRCDGVSCVDDKGWDLLKRYYGYGDSLS